MSIRGTLRDIPVLDGVEDGGGLGDVLSLRCHQEGSQMIVIIILNRCTYLPSLN